MVWNFKQDSLAAIDDNDISLTYKQLGQECDTFKSKMAPRSLVFTFCSNTIADFIGYVAFLQNGCVQALLNSLEEHEELISKYNPNYLWVPMDMAQKFNNYKMVYEKYNYILLENLSMKHKLYEELALLLTTSGSTGSPKFVRQSYKNIRSNAKSIAKYLNITSDERPITTLPINYTYGLSIINSHLLCGSTILITNKTIVQKEFWNFFNKYGATSFGGVPYTYEILKRLKFFDMSLPTLKTLTQAGGKLLPSLHAEFAEYCQSTNRDFIIMYGQCEATARMAYLPPEQNLSKIGSMGIAIPGGKLVLVDVNNQPISTPFTTGELIYYGDNVTLGYAQSYADLSKMDERGGMLETGDMAEFDEDRYFYIVGRKKRFLKIYGNRVNLDEAERILKNKFPDTECALSGKDDELVIFITDKQKGAQLRKYLSEKTGLNHRAFVVKYIESIPKSDAGKILYSKLVDINVD
ncbi:MAG: AMP-dependent synthetase [Epulopiscium sp. Nuni2H_MBin003]|nr:MAG: AMP-dependent synthetase [Epulopiscium sp. Nuni2H_MBin003]